MQTDVRCVSYDVSWPLVFESEAARIQSALSLQLHHVGSTAVPGLCAKPRLDIMGVASDPQVCIGPLQGLGYGFRGEHNIPFKWGFRMRSPIEVNLAVFPEGHPEIELNLLFRDILRSDGALRQAYADLKQYEVQGGKVRDAGNLFCRYTRNKDQFIRSVLHQAGFARLRVLRCEHPAEWLAFGDLVRQQPECPLWVQQCAIWDEVKGFTLTPLAAQLGVVCLVLCEGVQVVGVACCMPAGSDLPQVWLSLSAFSDQAAESYFRRFILAWLKAIHLGAPGDLGALFDF